MAANKTLVSLALQAISAKASKLAYDFDNNRLWEGDLERGLAELQAQLDDASRGARG